MPGCKKQTQKARIAAAVCWCLILGSLCTHSTANVIPTDDAKAIPDVIVADSTGILPEEGQFTSTPAQDENTKDTSNVQNQTAPLNENEEIPPGTWIQTEGEWYYLIDGIYKTGWLDENNHWYYFGEDGRMQIGWVLAQEQWYYTDEDGIMQTGWIEVDGKWYYLDESGAMQTGWLLLDGQWYYLNPSGDMQTGWLLLGEDWYYLNANGVMATGWIVVNGSRYFLNENGVWDASKLSETTSNTDAANDAQVALTFSGGPGLYTERLLNALEQCDAKATFFVSGEQITDYPKALQRMDELHCEIGCFLSFSGDPTDSQIQKKLEESDAALTEITGHASSLARLPKVSDAELPASSVEKPLILWSIDAKDNETSDINAMLDTILTTVQDGDIIQMHDIYEPSVTAVEILLPMLQEQGFKLVTVSELAASNSVSLTSGKIYEKL